LNSANLVESILVWTQGYGNHFRIIAFALKKFAGIDWTYAVRSALLTLELYQGREWKLR